MANTNLIDRQYPKAAVANLTKANIGAGNTVTMAIPVGALLLRLAVQTIVAFDSATTTTANVSDSTTTFAAAVDIKTTGVETVANVPKYYPSGGILTILLAETGATATVGQSMVVAEYVILNNGDAGIYAG